MGDKGLSERDGTLIVAGTCVGAGILALPVALYDLGFGGSIFLIAFLGLLNIASGMLIVEVLLRAHKVTHLPGLAERYVGRWAAILMVVALIVFTYGALVSYLISGGYVLEKLSGGLIPAWIGTMGYFCVATFIVFAGMWWLKHSESAIFTVMMLFIALVMLTALPFFTLSDVPLNLAALPMAFGVTVFACAVQEIIPTVGNAMRRNPHGFAKAVLVGMTFPMFLYIVWTVLIAHSIPPELLAEARVDGSPATVPLGVVVGAVAVFAGSAFALFATFTSFLGASYSLADALQDAFHEMEHRLLRRSFAVVLTVLPPLAIALSNPHGFLNALELAGFYGGSVFIGIIPPLMYFGAKKRGGRTPEFTVPFGRPIAAIVFMVFFCALAWKTWLLLMGQ